MKSYKSIETDFNALALPSQKEHWFLKFFFKRVNEYASSIEEPSSSNVWTELGDEKDYFEECIWSFKDGEETKDFLRISLILSNTKSLMSHRTTVSIMMIESPCRNDKEDSFRLYIDASMINGHLNESLEDAKSLIDSYFIKP